MPAPTLKWAYGGCIAGPYCQTGWYSSPAVADLDGDGQPEVIWGSYDVVALNGADGRAEVARARTASARLAGHRGGRPDRRRHAGDRRGPRRQPAHGLRPRLGERRSGRATRSAAARCARWRWTTSRPTGSSRSSWAAPAAARLGRSTSTNPTAPCARAGRPAATASPATAGACTTRTWPWRDLNGDGFKEIFGPTDTHYITALDRNGNQLPANADLRHQPAGPRSGARWASTWTTPSTCAATPTAASSIARTSRTARPPSPTWTATARSSDRGRQRLQLRHRRPRRRPLPHALDLQARPHALERQRLRLDRDPRARPGQRARSPRTTTSSRTPCPTRWWPTSTATGSRRSSSRPTTAGCTPTGSTRPSTATGRTTSRAARQRQFRFASEPVVADLDSDGQAEVIFTSWPQKAATASASSTSSSSQGVAAAPASTCPRPLRRRLERRPGRADARQHRRRRRPRAGGRHRRAAASWPTTCRAPRARACSGAPAAAATGAGAALRAALPHDRRRDRGGGQRGHDERGLHACALSARERAGGHGHLRDRHRHGRGGRRDYTSASGLAHLPGRDDVPNRSRCRSPATCSTRRTRRSSSTSPALRGPLDRRMRQGAGDHHWTTTRAPVASRSTTSSFPKGDSGTAARHLHCLAAPPPAARRFPWATRPPTAAAAAGTDYVGVAGAAVFPPGTTTLPPARWR